MWERGDQTWYCPFCNQQTIKVFNRPPHREGKSSRGSGVTSRYMVTKSQQTIILSEKCSNCGKTKAEIEPKLL